jgi:hypothetical protein
MSEDIHLFSNGTEWDIWESRNCDRCVKQGACDLADAIFDDSIVHDLEHGDVLPETAARLGYSEAEHGGTVGWPCKERRADAEPTTTAATEMVKSGADMLPGFEDVAPKPADRRYPG